MKKIITVIALLLMVGVGNSQDKEKRIKFNKGTLKICSSSHMTIKGYDGDEVVIKSLNNQSRFSYLYNFKDKNGNKTKSLDSIASSESAYIKSYKFITYQGENKELEKGLKPLGNKSTNPEDNLYLDITENSGELIIKDYKSIKLGQKKGKEDFSFPSFNSKYELLIPNTIKLLWNVENCTKKNSNTFYMIAGSKPWKLSDFKGEVEISTSYNSINLTNVTGPVIANTIGGNIKVAFNSTSPTKLYSLVSNEGYIDVTLPEDADINVDAIGDRILSDIDFKILNETVINGTKGMELQLNSGKTKMKLDAGSGSVYLRKRE